MVQGQGRSAQSDRLESQLVFTLGDGPAPADFAGDVVATGKNAKTQSSQNRAAQHAHYQRWVSWATTK